MAIKVVILFQQTTLQGTGSPAFPSSSPVIGYAQRVHLGGWSESLIWDGNNIGPLLNALKTGYGGLPALLPARAALLTGGASIVGIRLYAGGAGKGQSYAVAYPGPSAAEEDIPQMAVLVKAGSQGGAVSRRFTLRGIPDAQIAFGEFAPTPAYAALMANYFSALGNFSFYAIDPSSPIAHIFSINVSGLITTVEANQPFLVNQLVTVQKVLITADGIFRTWKGPVTAVGPAGNNLQVGSWPYGAGTQGIVTIKNKALFLISTPTCAVSRVVTRRVGRPFEQYRGRRSKRRKTA